MEDNLHPVIHIKKTQNLIKNFISQSTYSSLERLPVEERERGGVDFLTEIQCSSQQSNILESHFDRAYRLS